MSFLLISVEVVIFNVARFVPSKFILRVPNILLEDIPIFLILAFLGSMFIIYVSFLLKQISLLEKFGKQSLLVYLIHGLYLNLCIDFTNRYILHPDNILNSILFYVLVAVITVMFCWFTIKLFEKKQLSWILGKW